MSNKVKNVLSLVSCMTIVIFVMVALGRDIFHAVEEIFYDHQATLWTNSAFSRLTNKVALFAAVMSLFLIPFYFTRLVKEQYKVPNWVFHVKYVVSVLYIFVFIIVLLVFFPAVWITNGFEESIKTNFLGDCLFTHILIPLFLVLSFVFLDEKPRYSKKEPISIYAILGIYVLFYVFFVYVFKTWEDFYFLDVIVSKITIFGFIGASIVLLFIPFLIHKLLIKTK